jgi:hypothetical protein
LPDHITLERYGDVKAELARIGKPILENDIWIAALARQYDFPVATSLNATVKAVKELVREKSAGETAQYHLFFGRVAVGPALRPFREPSGRWSEGRKWLSTEALRQTAPSGSSAAGPKPRPTNPAGEN